MDHFRIKTEYLFLIHNPPFYFSFSNFFWLIRGAALHFLLINGSAEGAGAPLSTLTDDTNL